MKNVLKKLLPGLMAAVMRHSIIPTAALAAESGSEYSQGCSGLFRSGFIYSRGDHRGVCEMYMSWCSLAGMLMRNCHWKSRSLTRSRRHTFCLSRQSTALVRSVKQWLSLRTVLTAMLFTKTALILVPERATAVLLLCL